MSRKILAAALVIAGASAPVAVADAAYSGKSTNRHGTTRLSFSGGLARLTVSAKVARGRPAFAVDCRRDGGGSATSFAVAGGRSGQRRFVVPATSPGGAGRCTVKHASTRIATIRLRRT